jgi:hypothetical protein
MTHIQQCFGIIAARLTDMLHGNTLQTAATFRFTAFFAF